MKKLCTLLCLSMVALVGCGGGGGGGSSSSAGGSGSSGGGSAPSGSLVLTADCSGTNCGSKGNEYTGSGVGVWYATNKENSDQIINVNIRKLGGEKVYYAYTNWGTATQKLSSGTALKEDESVLNKEPKASNELSVSGNYEAPSQSVIETIGTQANEEEVALSPVPIISRKPAANAQSYTWKVSNVERPAILRATPTQLKGKASVSGANIYVWVDNSMSSLIKQNHVNTVLDRFAGRSGRKSIYALGKQWVGEPWGKNASRWSNLMSGSEKDLHVVITSLQPTGYIGYFYAGNDHKASTLSISNEALALFVDGNKLVSSSTSSWNPLSKNVLDVFSTLAHEFEHMIFYYEKTVSRTPNAQESEKWLDELAAMLFQFYYLSADEKEFVQTDGPEYTRVGQWAARPTCQLNDWSGTAGASSSCDLEAHYGKVGSLAAYLLRHYGAGIMKSLVQNPRRDISALESAVAAHGVNLADVQRRWGASLAISGTAFPKLYGFPKVSINGAEFPAINLKTLHGVSISSSLPSTVRPNSTVVYYRGIKNGNYTHRVKLPPKTSLTVIVQH